MVESFQLENIKVDPEAKKITKDFRDRIRGRVVQNPHA